MSGIFQHFGMLKWFIFKFLKLFRSREGIISERPHQQTAASNQNKLQTEFMKIFRNWPDAKTKRNREKKVFF